VRDASTWSAAVLLLAATGVQAAPEIDKVEVRATRLQGVANFDVPASVDTISLHGANRPGVSMSEALVGIPGLSAQDRQNYAQDTQLSIRGFGARSTFGVRGVRLFADGIPASMPDGQGQLSHFNLVAGDRIEVMRGPFSALYGNSSGGVVQLWSKNGEPGDLSSVRASFGSQDRYSLAAQLLGAAAMFGRADGLGYNLTLSRFETDGYRDHSAARRDSVNLKLRLEPDATRRIDLVVNYLDQPEAQDPLGLTRAQYQSDPRQATSVATLFNTRKSVRQAQAGLVYEQSLGDAHTLRAMGYAGQREVRQFLPIPAAVQNNPLHSGGVVDLDGDYGGVDLRWSWRGQWLGRALEFTLGGNFDQQQQQRRGYENHVGDTLGVLGRLRRDEATRVRNFDQFAQAWWRLSQRWSLLAGVRHSEVDFRSRDHYITASNPDDSGSVDYSATTPVGGIMFSPNEQLRLYASVGRGFETPTFNELGYRADGGAGLAFGLKPASSHSYELGAKWHGPRGLMLNAALFRADMNDELAVVRNVGGRSSYRNVGQARRQGFEASAALPLTAQWQLQLAYTLLDATFRSDYLVCAGTGCITPNVLVPSGSRISGVARHQAFARLQWQGEHWSAALEGVGASNLVVNDIGTETAPGYALMHLEAAREWSFGAGNLRSFARLENVLDRTYIGSIIVNEGNGRFYEPGPDRTFWLGAQWEWRL